MPDVDLKPTAEMAANAKRGLELRRQHGKGGTAVGVARARDLARRANLSPDWGGDAGKGWAERKTKELDKETAMRSDTYKAISQRLGSMARPEGKTTMGFNWFSSRTSELLTQSYALSDSAKFGAKRLLSLAAALDKDRAALKRIKDPTAEAVRDELLALHSNMTGLIDQIKAILPRQ